MTNLELKRWRINQGMTQQQLAERLGVSLRLINGWECGTEVCHRKMLDLAILGLEGQMKHERWVRQVVKDALLQVEAERQKGEGGK